MEYLIYCDESLSKGQFFSHFYGGALVRSKDYIEVKEALDARKEELNLLGEIKWTKVSTNYLDKYKEMMDLYFRFIKEGKIKIRIMFQAAMHEIEEHSDADKYHILYYQFIKHAFGLPYRDEYVDDDVNLKLLFDMIPDTNQQNDDFKAHICYLQELQQFKKTKAKEALFNHILALIQESDGVKVFRIEESTMPDTAKCRWRTPYRHWKFIPAKFK